MKKIKKVNLGAILLIILLIVIAIYVSVTEISRKKDKIKIANECKKYLSFEAEYTMLPEEYQTLDKIISKEEYTKYLNNVREELGKVIIQDDNILNINFKDINNSLDQEKTGTHVTIGKSREILKINGYKFKGDEVTVYIEDLLKKDVKQLVNPTWNDKLKIYEGEENINKVSNKVEDTIVLKKQDSEWKIMYTNLGDINNQESSDSEYYM